MIGWDCLPISSSQVAASIQSWSELIAGLLWMLSSLAVMGDGLYVIVTRRYANGKESEVLTGKAAVLHGLSVFAIGGVFAGIGIGALVGRLPPITWGE